MWHIINKLFYYCKVTPDIIFERCVKRHENYHYLILGVIFHHISGILWSRSCVWLAWPPFCQICPKIRSTTHFHRKFWACWQLHLQPYYTFFESMNIEFKHCPAYFFLLHRESWINWWYFQNYWASSPVHGCRLPGVTWPASRPISGPDFAHLAAHLLQPWSAVCFPCVIVLIRGQ